MYWIFITNVNVFNMNHFNIHQILTDVCIYSGTLVLLQCFWNYLANSVAKASFMSSREFMFYIFW